MSFLVASALLLWCVASTNLDQLLGIARLATGCGPILNGPAKRLPAPFISARPNCGADEGYFHCLESAVSREFAKIRAL